MSGPGEAARARSFLQRAFAALNTEAPTHA